MRKIEPSFKCLSDGYTLDSLRIYYAGNDSYLIRAAISGKWVLCTYVQRLTYDEYRIRFYTDPGGAKNYLLDLLSWSGYPFTRETFRFVADREFREDALCELGRFASALQ